MGGKATSNVCADPGTGGTRKIDNLFHICRGWQVVRGVEVQLKGGRGTCRRCSGLVFIYGGRQCKRCVSCAGCACIYYGWQILGSVKFEGESDRAECKVCSVCICLRWQVVWTLEEILV